MKKGSSRKWMPFWMILKKDELIFYKDKKSSVCFLPLFLYYFFFSFFFSLRKFHFEKKKKDIKKIVNVTGAFVDVVDEDLGPTQFRIIVDFNFSSLLFFLSLININLK